MKLIFALFALFSLQAFGADYQRRLDVVQGFEFKNTSQAPIGFVTKLKIGGYSFTPEFSVTNPLNPTQTFSAVSVLSGVFWETGQGDPLYLGGQVSVASKQLINWLIYSGMANVDVEAEVMVFEYNSTTQSYDWSFGHKELLLGVLAKNGDELHIAVSDKASTEIQSPQNYDFNVGFIPTYKRIITLCTSGKCILKPFGFY